MSSTLPLKATESGFQSDSSDDDQDCTPEQLSRAADLEKCMTVTPIKFQNKRLMDLKREGEKSPVLRVPASPLMTRLGYGTGVGVYLLERSPRATGEIRSPWAIKKLAKIKNLKQGMFSARLQYEASVLKKLEHPNIVGYRAFGNPTNSETYLAMERGSHSLDDLIQDRSGADVEVDDNDERDGSNIGNPFPAKYIFKMALDIANALDYLHTEAKLVHGDLKSANVLIFEDFEVCKLCDFGVARKIKDDGTLEGTYVGTEIWNPMEVIQLQRGNPKYPITAKADIYPFGLTIFEMISLQPPHIPTDCDDLDSTMGSGMEGEDSSDFEDSDFEEALQQRIGTRPLLPVLEFDESYNKILETFYCCTEEDPSARPTAEDIIRNLCIKSEATSANTSEVELKLDE